MFRKFWADKKGNLAVAAGILAVPLVAAVGAAVDYSQVSRYRASMQQALDAAALATAKQLGTNVSDSQLEQFAEDFFFANLDDVDVGHVTFTYDSGNSTSGTAIELSAHADYPVQFASVLGLTTVGVDVDSYVKAANDTLEIALVLDNSGSMSHNSRLSTAKTAAINLITSLATQTANSNHATPLKVAVVPFAGSVNVGNTHAGASWMDTQGKSSIHHENLNWADNPEATAVGSGYQDANGNWLTRFTLFNRLNNTSWAGCVEMRPYPYHTNDTTPVSTSPDTLYVPMFAPDEPDNYTGYQTEELPSNGGSAIYCTMWYWYPYHAYCRQWSDGYWGYYHPTEGFANRYGGDYDYYGNYVGGGGNSIIYGGYISEETYENNYITDNHNMPDGVLARAPETTGTGANQNKRQEWTWKYTNQTPSTPYVGGFGGGPNLMCSTTAITPLTSNVATTAVSAINSMQADGSTNVQSGVAWGWRVLSSAEPFTEGFSEAQVDNQKIMVVMTDGNNTYYQGNSLDYSKSNYNKSIYSAWGYTKNGRLFTSYDGSSNPSHTDATFTSAMDEHMVETCNNAKAAGVTIYTVAYDVPNGSSVKTALEACASTSLKTNEKLYFDAAGSSQLLATFTAITEDISSLRIAK
ncbi:MAG: TadE/TadG family type IV pilus assembly protein [Pseudomonadota bacterium]